MPARRRTRTAPDASPATARTPTPARTPVSLVAGLTLGTLALASVALGFYQGPLGAWLTMK